LDWKAFCKRTIVLVFLISLAVHVLLLVGFGGVAIFKGKMPTMPFAAQNVPSDQAETTAPPPTDEVVPEEPRPDDMMPKDTSVAEESAPPLEMMTVPGGASWAPAIPKDMKTSLTGSVGGAGTGTGTGTGAGKGAARATVKLFGVEVKAQKLGVIIDISKSMQKYTPQLTAEIFEKFPDADVIFTNGGGMMDWPDALKKFNDEVEENKKKAKENKKEYRGPSKMEKPVLGRFNGSEASDWVPIRGSKIGHESYRGLKEDYPELYDKLSKRGNAWFISSFQDANGVYLAFQELIRRKAEAIYWFSDFESPVEGQEAVKVAALINEKQIEVILHSVKGGVGKVETWANQVKAQVVQAKF
jgi:hypothetical protein